MTPERFHAAVKDAFARAVALDAGDRDSFLAGLRYEHPEVAEEVQELLRHHDPDDTFLEDSVMDRLAGEAPDTGALVGQRLGRFTIRALIASGAMGAVYEAEQDEPRRAVAVKVLRAGAMSPRALRRFRYEAEVLGLLKHPGVAQIYEAGTHADGALTAPYFAMELVPNARPFTRYVREERLPTAEALRLFLDVCRAVHHGHQKGVIHRDLKPANILVGTSGQPKVIDFGVARAVGNETPDAGTVGTLAGQFVGTLQYMSPEQLRPGGDDLDVRTDLYALGVVLYELVCGQPPHDLSGLTIVEAADLLRRRRVPLAGARERSARGDLEAVIAKATEPERTRRYQSAQALAEDIERYLRSEPVLAARPGLWRQFRLFARRRAGTVAAVGAIAVALVIATSVSVWFAVAAGHARAAETSAKEEAERSALRASRVVTLLRDMIALGESGADATVTGMLDEAADRLDAGIEEDPLVEASLRLAIGQTFHGLGRYAEAERQLRAALAGREASLGIASTPTLEAASALALTLAERGRLAEAMELTERARRTLEADEDADPQRLAGALVSRAQLAWRLGRPTDALALYDRAGRLYDEGSAEWIDVGLRRAEIFLEAGRADEAARVLQRLSPKSRAAATVDRRRLGRLLAQAARGLGNIELATRRLAELVAENRLDLGPLHPETLRSIAELERTRAVEGDAAAAAARLADLVAGAEVTLAPGRPVLAELRAAQAWCLRRAGLVREAEDVLRQRVTDLAAADTADRPSVISAVLDVIDLMLERGATAPAGALAAEIRRTSAQIFPADSAPRARATVLQAQADRLARVPERVSRPELDEARAVLALQLGVANPVTRRADELLSDPAGPQ